MHGPNVLFYTSTSVYYYASIPLKFKLVTLSPVINHTSSYLICSHRLNVIEKLCIKRDPLH